jgi:hypothetical protein
MLARILIPIAAILTFSTYASEVKITYSSSNNLILNAKNCELLNTQHQAICDWKKSNDSDFAQPNPSSYLCRASANGTFNMTVSSCLPTFVKMHQHKKLYKHGANCWGTALSFKKISLRPRFIWSQEMTYWMNSPICRKLSVGEEKRSGDLLGMYGPEYTFERDELTEKGIYFWNTLFPGRVTPSPVPEGYSGYHHFLHTETYLTQDISFGKDSPNKDDRFEFHETNEIYGRPRSSECQEAQHMDPYLREYQKPPKDIKGSKCSYFSLAYRCESFPDYFSKQDLSAEDIQIQATITELQKAQDKLFSLVSTANTVIAKEEIKRLVKLADQAAANSLEELGLLSTDKNHEMLLTLQYFTASGIRKSLELANLIAPTEEL